MGSEFLRSLIQEVQDYAWLYDPTNKFYSDQKVKSNTWREIGVKLKVTATRCQESWKYLNIQFKAVISAKYHQKISGTSNNQGVWELYEDMLWLKQFLSLNAKSKAAIVKPLKSDQNAFVATASTHPVTPQPSAGPSRPGTSTTANVQNSAPAVVEDSKKGAKRIIKRKVTGRKKIPKQSSAEKYGAMVGSMLKDMPLQKRKKVMNKISAVLFSEPEEQCEHTSSERKT